MFVVLAQNKMRLVALVALVGALGTLLWVAAPQALAQEAPVVAIDAGHGGYDGGVTGLSTGVRESDVNLSIAQYAGAYLVRFGYRVVYTRTGRDLPTGARKRNDLDERLATVRNANASVLVSIHCNFYPSPHRRGVQVFYHKGEDEILARHLQESLNAESNLPQLGRSFSALWGDYYLLRHAPCPAAIVECGFLSNREDEALLVDEHYRMTLAYLLAMAIIDHLRA